MRKQKLNVKKENLLDLKIRLEKNENFSLKILSEVGDLVRIMRGLIARVDKLERRINNAK